MKKIKKILSLGIVAALLSATVIPAYADVTPSGELTIGAYINGVSRSNIFVGETFEQKIVLDNFSEDIAAVDLILKYNPAVVSLCDTSGTVVSEVSSFSGTVSSEILPSATRDKVFPDNGFMVYVGAYPAGSYRTVSDPVNFAVIKFNAVSAGNGSLTFANSTTDAATVNSLIVGAYGGNYNMKRANPNGLLIADANSDYFDVTSTCNATTILAKPGEPTALAWGEEDYTVSWTAPSTGCRGYILKLYKQGQAEPVEEYNLSEDTLTYNFATDIFTHKAGTYSFSVTAKGGTNNSDPVNGASKLVEKIPMSSTAAVYTSETDTASWTPVAHASGYVVTITDSHTGTTVKTENVSGALASSFADLVGDLVGDFNITVTAVPEDAENYRAAGETPIYYSTGSTVQGKVTFLNIDTFGGNSKINDSFLPTVKLTDVSSEAVYQGAAYRDGSGDIVFKVRHVPNGSYNVEIIGNDILTRGFYAPDSSDPNAVDESEPYALVIASTSTVNISKGDGIGIYIGDVRTDAQKGIFLNDLNTITSVYNSTVSLSHDFYKDSSDLIRFEMPIIMKLFGSSIDDFVSADDYQGLTIIE